MFVNVRAVVRYFKMLEMSKCFFFCRYRLHGTFGFWFNCRQLADLEGVCCFHGRESKTELSLGSDAAENISRAPPPPARWAPTSIFKGSQVCGGFARLQKLTLQFPPRHMLDMEEKLEETGF